MTAADLPKHSRRHPLVALPEGRARSFGMSNENVYRRRLVSEQVTKDLDTGLKTLYKWLQTDDATGDKKKLDEILLQFRRCENEVANHVHLSNVYHREREEYDKLNDNIENKITQTLHEKTVLLDQLAAAKENRSHKEQYDALADIALKYPARVETEEKIQMVNEDTARLERKKVELDSKLDIHRKDFLALSYVVKSLTDHMSPEEESTAA